jgi:hypothetical protein
MEMTNDSRSSGANISSLNPQTKGQLQQEAQICHVILSAMHQCVEIPSQQEHADNHAYLRKILGLTICSLTYLYA